MILMHRAIAVFRRELGSYFATPLAYIFVAAFVVLSGFFTFEFGGFFRREQADLVSFFNFHPWLYLVLMPPLSMRLWAEERQTGSIELLLTLPISTRAIVLAKFFAAWVFLAFALALTSPIWWTVNYLGDPDNGIIMVNYLGSWFMGGAFLALGSFVSALTKNQIIAFILSLVTSLLFLIFGFPPLAESLNAWLPQQLASALIGLSFLSHFQSITRGVLDIRDVGFFLVFIACWLWATVALIELKRRG